MEYGVFVSNEYGRMLFLEYSNEFKESYRLGKSCMIYHCEMVQNATDLENQTFKSPFVATDVLYRTDGKYCWSYKSR